MTVYLSGPVSNNPDYQNCFAEAEQLVREAGHKVVSPLSVPVLSEEIYSWDDCMKVCIALMRKCDCVLMVGDWRASVGARIEKLWAQGLGIPVYDSVGSLPKV